jgi:hypothetical protein
MCLVGALPYVRGLFLFLFIAQVLGGITAAAICSAIFPGPLTVRTNLGGGTSVVQGLFIEIFLTVKLVFIIFMLAAEKHKGTFIAPIAIGLSLFITELTGKLHITLVIKSITILRCLFHQRFRQSCAVVRAICGNTSVPFLSLDLLGGTNPLDGRL